MDKEIIKAMNKKPKKNSPFKKWWDKNRHIVMRILFFPVWAVIWSRKKIIAYLNANTQWNESRANEILNYYVPRFAEWDEESHSFYFFDNGYGWNIGLARKYLKFRDRRFWTLYTNWGGGKIRSYLIHNFNLDGFTKEVIDYDYGRTEINFKMDNLTIE